jgi:hypothetical protein
MTGNLNYTSVKTSKSNSAALLSATIMNNEWVNFRTKSTGKHFLKRCPTFESLYKGKSLKPYKFHRVTYKDVK